MLKLIVLIIIGVLALSFFGISLQSIIQSPAAQTNFAYLGQLIASLWHSVTTVFIHTPN